MDRKYSHQAAGTFEIKSWDEKTWEGQPWNEQSGAKLTHTRVTTSFQGDFEGEGVSQSLIAYRDDSSASYVGLERLTGRLGNRSGSFVLQASGAFEGNEARTTWSVVPGSGTGELAGLRGEGGYVAQHGDEQVPFKLDYDFEG
jgi:hypothetical protein